MTTAAVVGSTGLVGSHILSTLLTLPNVSSVSALARRNLKAEDASGKLQPVIEPDTMLWATRLNSLQPTPKILYSALGTTRAQAGSLENQRKVDYDLNLDLAKAAKAAGAEVYVLISSAAISTSSPFPYSKMKAEIEEAAIDLDFPHLVLIKPGMIIGDREDSRPAEAAFRHLARFAGRLSGGRLKDFWAQDADVIAKAAVMAGIKCAEGQAPPGKVWVVQQADILKLGRDEFKEKYGGS